MSDAAAVGIRMSLVLVWLAAGGCGNGEVQRCDADADCAGGVCRQASFEVDDLERLPLVCGERSGGAEPFAVCNEASGCARGICLLAGTCGLPCARDAGCPDDARCGRAYAVGAASTAHPVDVCLVDVVATVPVSRSRSQHVLEAPADGEMLRLEGGAEETLLFMLSPRKSRDLLVTRLTALPSQTRLFDLAHVTPHVSEAPINPVHDASQPVVALLPNGPRGAAFMDASAYELQVRAREPGIVDVTRYAAERRGGGRLDLNVFYVAGASWAPQKPSGPPMLREALEQADALLQPAGIRIGSLRQRIVPGALQERLSRIDGRPTRMRPRFPELLELFELSAGAGNAALNVFLVETIEAPEGGRLGVAGGVPVPWGVHGTGASGIALAVGSMPDAATLGRWLAHEIGHALGLFHTTERDGALLEPLPDTPRCELARDADGDEHLSADECDGQGAGNVMFWDAAGDTLTPQQAEVMQQAWILRSP